MKSVHIGTLTQAVIAAEVFSLAALLFLWAHPSYAAQTSSRFTVNINLQPNGNLSNTGLCRSSNRIGSFGEAVTIECSTGKAVTFSGGASKLPWSAVQDGHYRFIIQLSGSGVPPDSDRLVGAGTVTSWRIVNLADREYLELMVGW